MQAGWTNDIDYPKIARNSALTFDIFTQPALYEFGISKLLPFLVLASVTAQRYEIIKRQKKLKVQKEIILL